MDRGACHGERVLVSSPTHGRKDDESPVARPHTPVLQEVLFAYEGHAAGVARAGPGSESCHPESGF